MTSDVGVRVRGACIAHLIESDGPGGAERMLAHRSCPPTAKAGSRASSRAPESLSSASDWSVPFPGPALSGSARRFVVIGSPWPTATSSPWPYTAPGPAGGTPFRM